MFFRYFWRFVTRSSYSKSGAETRYATWPFMSGTRAMPP
jgi:hypothetical protein